MVRGAADTGKRNKNPSAFVVSAVVTSLAAACCYRCYTRGVVCVCVCEEPVSARARARGRSLP